jgi:hypothetical protein
MRFFCGVHYFAFVCVLLYVVFACFPCSCSVLVRFRVLVLVVCVYVYIYIYVYVYLYIMIYTYYDICTYIHSGKYDLFPKLLYRHTYTY